MKKILLLPLLAILLSSLVLGGTPSPPYTFAGALYIYGNPCDNCEISFSYIDSREDTGWKKTTTNYAGDYQFTNKLFKDGDYARPGDRIEVKFCNENVKSACKQIIKFGHGAGTITNVQVEHDRDYEIINPRGDTVVIITDSDVMIDGPARPLVCDDGSEAIDGKCPTDIWTDLFYVALGILGTFVFGVGFVKGLAMYYWKKGSKQIREGKMYNSPEMVSAGKKNRSRALKMTMTAIKNSMLGKYDRYKKPGG